MQQWNTPGRAGSGEVGGTIPVGSERDPGVLLRAVHGRVRGGVDDHIRDSFPQDPVHGAGIGNIEPFMIQPLHLVTGYRPAAHDFPTDLTICSGHEDFHDDPSS
jgi:hypothetical protein